MQQSRSRPRALIVLLGLIAIVASACSGSTASTAPSAAATAAASAAAAATATPPPAVTPPPIAPDAPGPNGGVVISWFVGLGAGAQPQQLQAESQFVNDFNAKQKDVYIALEIQNNNVAAQKLKTRIAAGDAPDIIGPVGVEGLNLFRDNLLDLAPLIAKTSYSVPGVDPKLVDFFKLGANGATIGVPYAVYPSYLYFNKDLFDEAGLPYPPTKVGELYQGKPWDMDAVRTLGMKLTVDSAGNDATSAKFDPTKVVQWGFDMQYSDNSPLAESSLFGPGSFVAADGKTAQIPANVTTGEKWYNAGVWTDHFIPSAAQISSDLLDKGNEFESGNLAMNESHTWFTCCVYPAAPAKPKVKSFGWAIAPSYNGVTTAKLHADTFSLLNTTKHPDEAFKALTALVASPELLTLYGAMPANPAQQDAFFKSIDATFPGIKLDWTHPAGHAGLPGRPQPSVVGPQLRQVEGRLAGLPEQVPDHGRCRHRQGAGHVEDDPPGHLRRAGVVG